MRGIVLRFEGLSWIEQYFKLYKLKINFTLSSYLYNFLYINDTLAYVNNIEVIQIMLIICNFIEADLFYYIDIDKRIKHKKLKSIMWIFLFVCLINNTLLVKNVIGRNYNNSKRSATHKFWYICDFIDLRG